MESASYQPWFPLKRNLSPYPLINCQLNNLSLTLSWQGQDTHPLAMEIYFPTIAGLQVIDESSYQTHCHQLDANNTPFPLEQELNHTIKEYDYFNLPWPIWKSVKNARLHCYGQLGDHIYQALYSYYIIGQECVYLIDTECEPDIIPLLC
ncbi:hypothetical protein [Shewanella mangrovisoli]|uniref:hypothetical protein n=1 Tax=Shewanella mangrovisoli TaxID=2864211 RepID=UPI0035B9B3CF